jgi:hypothetical protein
LSSERASASIDDYKEAKTRALAKLREFDENGGDPIIVAKEILKIVLTDQPKLHYPVGKEKSALSSDCFQNLLLKMG